MEGGQHKSSITQINFRRVEHRWIRRPEKRCLESAIELRPLYLTCSVRLWSAIAVNGIVPDD